MRKEPDGEKHFSRVMKCLLEWKLRDVRSDVDGNLSAALQVMIEAGIPGKDLDGPWNFWVWDQEAKPQNRTEIFPIFDDLNFPNFEVRNVVITEKKPGLHRL